MYKQLSFLPGIEHRIVPAGLKNVKPIPTSKNCIVLQPFYQRSSSGTWQCLVQCPSCKTTIPMIRSNVKRRARTYCRDCSHILQREPLPRSDICIIIDPLCGYDVSGSRSQAMAECPICHKTRPLSRNWIRTKKHTICLPCSRALHSGPAHHMYREGDGYQYGDDWKEIAETVRYRDRYHCQMPGCKVYQSRTERAMHVHHIIPYEDTQDNSETNLITLCPSHHKWSDHHLALSQSTLDSIIMMMYGPGYR